MAKTNGSSHLHTITETGHLPHDGKPLPPASSASSYTCSIRSALPWAINCFMMLTFYFVAAIGAQNPMGSCSTAALTLAASWVGIGVGAAIGGILVELALDPAMIAIASAISLFMLVSYQTTALSQFDFDVFIARTVPIDGNGPGKSVAAVPASARMDASLSSSAEDAESHDAFESSRDEINAQCESISETYGLTKREREVLPLLAHGRTSPIIQRELVITQNTVKSHVRHIYAKLGFTRSKS